MEDIAVDRRSKAIEELVRGREFANQLRQIIINRDRDDEPASAAAATHHLVKNVVTSFANTLFLFNKYPTYQSLLVDPPACLVISPVKSDDEEQDSQDSFSTSPTALKEEDTRGFYKRKRSIETWTKVSETQTDHDDHQWRKYGQKQIQNAKYTRNYYRCTHKYDQGCQATKHVQKVQEEPPLYRITYYGHHTCRNLLNPAEILLEDGCYSTFPPPPDSSILLSFDNSFPNPTISSSFFPSTTSSSAQAMEYQEKCNNNNNNNNNHQVVAPSSSSAEPTLDNSQRHVTVSSTLESEDYWDVMMSGFIYGGSFVDDDFLPFDGF